MNKLINFRYLPYLVFLVIPSYIAGIAITEILLLLLIILFFFLNKNLSYFKDPKVLFLISFSVLAGFSGLLNLHYTELKIASTFHFRYVLIAVVVGFFLDRLTKEKKIFNERNLDLKFFNIFFSAIFFIVIDSIIQFFLGYNLFGQEIVNSRVSGIFGNELILGSFLLQILPIIFFQIFFFNLNKAYNYKYFVLFFSLYLISIYISSSRTPFFLTIFFIFLIIFFVKNFRNILLKSLSILLIFLICEAFFEFGKIKVFHRVFVITFIQLTDHHYHPRDELSEIISKKKDEDNISDLEKPESKNQFAEFFDTLLIFSDDHQNHYILAFELFKKEPIIGNGPKGFRSYCRKVAYDPPVGICSTHPHNYFIQILSELGLIGILFYLTGIIFIISKLINSFLYKRENINSPPFYAISFGLIILLFPIVPSGNFFNNWVSIINYYYIGFYLYTYKQLYN